MKIKLIILIIIAATLNTKAQTWITGDSLICVGESTTLTAHHDFIHNWCFWQPAVQSSTPVTLANIATISPTITTTFSVICYDPDANASYATFTQSVAMCLGIKKDFVNTTVHIYPNPVSEALIIEGLEKNTGIEIYNTVGAICFTAVFETEKTEIILKEYPSGIYFIKIKLGTQEFTRKIVKQ